VTVYDLRRAGRLRATLRLRIALLAGALILVAGAVLVLLDWLLARAAAHPSEILQYGAVALVAVAAGGIAAGYLVTGRALRPLHRVTAAARHLTEETLDERIRHFGPDDEVAELAATYDAMLDRIAAAFDSQRRFVANASHELRTPLSIIRAELDVTMSNPNPSRAELDGMADVVRQATDRSDRLIDSLLTLARTEGSTLAGSEVDLAVVAGRVLTRMEPEADARSIRLGRTVDRAVVRGDEVLLERLIENLLENAIRYNRDGGWVEVRTGAEGAGLALSVRNSGDDKRIEDVDALFEPFRRGDQDRVRSDRGVGLGLAIVRAVAEAHGGAVHASARAGGGLEVEVELPAPVPAERVATREAR
jgi:signal transduction histidine kinase